MPQCVTNLSVVTGPVDELKRFKNLAFDGDRLDFENIIPMPTEIGESDKFVGGLPEWTAWTTANWGATGNSDDWDITLDSPERLEFRFATEGEPPIPIFKELGRQFPLLKMRYRCIEENWCFAHLITIKDYIMDIEDIPAPKGWYKGLDGNATSPA